MTDAKVFGGTVLTATDIYVRSTFTSSSASPQLDTIGDPAKVTDLSDAVVQEAQGAMKRLLEVRFPPLHVSCISKRPDFSERRRSHEDGPRGMHPPPRRRGVGHRPARTQWRG